MIYTVTLNPAIDKEVQVDSLAFNQVLRAQNENIDFGGKGFNISRFLRKFDVKNIALGFIGGNTGKTLQNGLCSLGIETDFTFIKGETRTNISYVTSGSSKYLKVNQSGPIVTIKEQEQLIEKIDSLAKAGDWWVLAGSLPNGIDSDFYAILVEMIAAKGAQVILDSSGEAFLKGCQMKPFLIKPNEIEAQQLLNIKVSEEKEDLINLAKQTQKFGPQNVVLSLGDQGAILVSQDGVYFADSIKIKEANPTGAGDSMVAGMIMALSQGKSIVKAFAFGMASGAATASMPGTKLGTPIVVNDLLKKVQVIKIE